ncbi:hypothetical protein C4K88_06855 [Arthrobacter pityocampae]|uniref:DUF7793 domain-containing protein n=1 Tax=Arthrobacter pityocampae TaxID=547334 RepID=A0A2S5IXY9_9MICC|nr:hypothetical protein [Arthrobacter pityocampae]PPB49413.1 hypothetical protein C4K88_06855 [Arthrobacter pityocampae]
MTIDDAPRTAVETFTATMCDGVLWVEWHAGTSVDDADAAALVARADAISENVCPPMLVELNGMVTLSRNALLRFARDLNIAAMAIVGPTAVDSTLAAFFAEVHDPPYPTRYFRHRAHALPWLTGCPHAS